ncbi:MAG: hypothetical protein MI867_12900 [Pseudomonadales bacterium]|nr:hypothetical protein [Pseudomonadales bacterium]
MMNRLLKIVLVVSFISSTSLAYSNSNESGLLDFRLKKLFNQRKESLTKHEGLPIVMVFFEERCGWCLKLMQDLNAIQNQCPNMLQPIAIGIDTGSLHGLKKLARKAAVTYPVYIATDSLLAGIGGVEATPYTLFADKNGAYKGRLRGYIPTSKLLSLVSQQFSVESNLAEGCLEKFNVAS